MVPNPGSHGSLGLAFCASRTIFGEKDAMHLARRLSRFLSVTIGTVFIVLVAAVQARASDRSCTFAPRAAWRLVSTCTDCLGARFHKREVILGLDLQRMSEDERLASSGPCGFNRHSIGLASTVSRTTVSSVGDTGAIRPGVWTVTENQPCAGISRGVPWKALRTRAARIPGYPLRRRSTSGARR